MIIFPKLNTILVKIVRQRRIYLHRILQYSDLGVRVRFAPSPTGYLHVGGLRTALYNYLFAKSHSGKFILRIEDTDTSRTVPGSAEAIENDLQWLSLTPDESPKYGGNVGPYTQSQRLHIYHDHAQKLIKKGAAYKCFCSSERLEGLKKLSLGYDNKCRALTTQQIEQLTAEGTPYCIRMKLSTEPVDFTDLVYGDRSIGLKDNEGDTIIMKTNGTPTYFLANVVDDHLMGITHVLRGSEWLSTIPKHLLLYKAFDWDLPLFAHLPQLMNLDGTKLSKRQEDLHLQELRRQGVSPGALLNLVRASGGGFRDPESEKIYSLAELVQMIDLITTHPTTLDMAKLEEYGRLDFQGMVSSEEELALMVDKLKLLVVDQFGSKVDVDLSETNLRNFLIWGQNRVTKLSDFTCEYSYLWIHPHHQLPQEILELKVDCKCVVSYIIESFSKLDSAQFTPDEVSCVVKSIQKEHKLKTPTMMKLLRLSICGTKVGAPVIEVLPLLGRETCLRRLNKAHSVL